MGGRVESAYDPHRSDMMKGLILWIMGVPISVIILLYIFVFN